MLIQQFILGKRLFKRISIQKIWKIFAQWLSFVKFYQWSAWSPFSRSRVNHWYSNVSKCIYFGDTFLWNSTATLRVPVLFNILDLPFPLHAALFKIHVHVCEKSPTQWKEKEREDWNILRWFKLAIRTFFNQTLFVT